MLVYDILLSPSGSVHWNQQTTQNVTHSNMMGYSFISDKSLATSQQNYFVIITFTPLIVYTYYLLRS